MLISLWAHFCRMLQNQWFYTDLISFMCHIFDKMLVNKPCVNLKHFVRQVYPRTLMDEPSINLRLIVEHHLCFSNCYIEPARAVHVFLCTVQLPAVSNFEMYITYFSICDPLSFPNSRCNDLTYRFQNVLWGVKRCCSVYSLSDTSSELYVGIQD